MDEKGGIVKSYSFVSQSYATISQFFRDKAIHIELGQIGMPGLPMDIYGIERNFMETVNCEYAFLADMIHDPYNTGKYYSHPEVLHMLYDIQEYSQYEEGLDPIKLISSNPLDKNYFHSQVFNFIVPEGLRGETFNYVGENLRLTINDSNNPKRKSVKIGNLKFNY